MTSNPFVAVAVSLAAVVSAPFFAEAKEIKLDDGSTCTIIEQKSSEKGGVSSSVTAGSGSVSSTTTVGGSSSGGSTTSSAGSSVTTGSSPGESFSTTSVTRPDGTTITRRSDGTCAILQPEK
ncbi:hypothetical protein [Ensifer canadensis]